MGIAGTGKPVPRGPPSRDSGGVSLSELTFLELFQGIKGRISTKFPNVLRKNSSKNPLTRAGISSSCGFSGFTIYMFLLIYRRLGADGPPSVVRYTLGNLTPATATLIRDDLALDADQSAVAAIALLEGPNDVGDQASSMKSGVPRLLAPPSEK